MSRVILQEEPFLAAPDVRWSQRGSWPAFWIDAPNRSVSEPSAAIFRLPFSADAPATVRLHVSADNRYRLFLDGQPLGRGPERGDPQHWRFESYDVEITPGSHILVAFTWWLATLATYAQMSVRPGFLLAAEGEWQQRLSTGVAPWEASPVSGIDHVPVGKDDYHDYYAAGPTIRVRGDEYPWGWETGNAGKWSPAVQVAEAVSTTEKFERQPYWMLAPTTLPPMISRPFTAGTVRYLTDDVQSEPVQLARHRSAEAGAWQQWLHGNATVTIPAGVTRTAIIDLEEYYCAFPKLQLSGGKGARVQLRWSEGLYRDTNTWHKENRGEIEGKVFVGVGDTFFPDGGEHRAFSTLWWEVGRYLALQITTADDPLLLESLTFEETRYPLEMEGNFTGSDQRLQTLIAPALRTLQMCAHETYMDCPYYEQLMYIGDTRLQALVTYYLTRDDRLPRKALECFDQSRMLSGLTQSRYPSKVAQVIPTFSLWWVCMVHDYWMWRDDPAFVRARMLGVRAVLEYYRTLQRPDGLFAVPQGWKFVDWVPGWKTGIPPMAETEPSSIINLQCILSLLAKAEMEEAFGERCLASRDRETASQAFAAVWQRFWNSEKGALADDAAQKHYSEHAQCLALLTGLTTEAQKAQLTRALLTAQDLARTTIYFSHYLFETYYRLRCPEKIIERLGLWFDLVQLDLKTLVEMPEPGRSDCHAWSSHPLFHYYASFLGIRPQSPGFRRVRIAPQLGPLEWAQGVMPHPAGEIHVRLRNEQGNLHAQVSLPAGITGTLVWEGREYALQPGENNLG